MVIIIPTVIAFILLTLTQTVQIRISKREEFKIDADVIFLRILLYPDRSNSAQGRKKKNKSITTREKLLLITECIERCDVKINSLSVKAENLTGASAIPYGIKTAILSALAAFISSRARSFSFDSDHFLKVSENITSSIQFDVTLELTFLEALILLLRLKSKKRRFS